MNKLFIYFGLVAAVLLTGCYKDKGNIDYKPLSDAKISGIGYSYTLYLGDKWNVPVEIEYSLDTPEEVAYLWKVNGDTIATTKDLDVTVSFPLKENMPAEYVVTDLSNGVRTIIPFLVTVKSEFSQGWMILSEQEEHSVLGYFRDGDGRFYADIYNDINQEHLSKGATRLVEHFLSPFEPSVTALTGQVFVACSEGPGYSVELDGDSFERVIYTKDEFVDATPADFRPEAYESMPSMETGKGFDYLISNGKVYTRALYDGMSFQDGKYSNIPNAYNGGNYKLAPAILRGNIIWGDYLLGFDNVSGNFVQFADGEVLTLNPAADMAGGFSMVNTGLTWIDGGTVAIFNDVEGTFDTYVTFMKDKDGKVQVMNFQVMPKMLTGSFAYMSMMQMPVRDTEGNPVVWGGNIINANTRFAYCDKGNILYIATGNNLYAFDHAAMSLRLLKTYDKPIVEIGMNRLNQMELGIAFDNGNGTSDFGVADVSYIGGGEIKGGKYYTVEGKVKDILYKVGNQLLISGMN